MMSIFLDTNRSFQRKVFWIFLFAYVFATLLAIPFIFSYDPPDFEGVWLSSLIWDLIGVFVIGSLALSLGLLLGARTGLGIPFIEGAAAGKPIWYRTKGVLGLVILISLASIMLILFVGVIFMALVMALQENALNAFADLDEINYPEIWRWVLVSINAGICEEIIFRFGLMTLLVWLGSLISRGLKGRPARWVVWTAILISSLAFGVAHLWGVLPVPDSLILRSRVVIQNSLIGIVLGWLYWKFGLESAMFTHFLIDIGFYVVFIPLMRSNRLILIGIALVILALLVSWAWKAIEADRMNSDQNVAGSKTTITS